MWEPVIYSPAPSGRLPGGMVSDVLTVASPRVGHVGAKPLAWVRWVLDLMGYRDGDTVDDLFPGSGAVSEALAQSRLELTGCDDGE